MRDSLFSNLLTLFVFASLSIVATAQQFSPEYFSFDTIRPAVQVDLNGDGIPDFIAQDRVSGVDELLSSGIGSFSLRNFFIAGSGGGYPIASGDFNSDGKTDVVLFQPLGIAFGDGKGGFTSVQPISWSNANQQFNSARAQVADFNGDGKPDVAIASDTINGTQPSTFQAVMFINNGSGFSDGVSSYHRQVPA